MHRPRFLACAAALLCQLTVGSVHAQDAAPSAPAALPPAYFDPTPSAPALTPTAPAPLRQPASGLLPFRPQLGLGIRASGIWAEDDLLSYGAGGVGLELLFRVQSRVTLELAAQYQRSRTLSSYYGVNERTDAPLLLGLRVHLGPAGGAASPYLVAAFGADYARLTSPAFVGESWFSEWQGGAGFEGRFGRRLALSVDVRGFGRARPGGDARLDQAALQGETFSMLKNVLGVLFNVGFAVYS